MNDLVRWAWVFLCLSPLWVLGQATQPDKFRFGKVYAEDLELGACSFDPEAGAMVLGEKASLSFLYSSTDGFTTLYEYHVRIKVFNADGYDYADGEIMTYQATTGSREDLGRVQGYTYNLIDGKVEREKLDKDAIFSEDVSENWRLTRFTLPKVQDGTVIEYRYTINSDFISNLRKWEYQRQIPVRFSEVEYSLPEYFDYQAVNTGGHPLTVNEKDYRRTSISGMDLQTHYYRWRAEQVPAIRQEPYMTAVEDYASCIQFQLLSYKFPGSSREIVMGTYDQFSQTLLEMSSFGEFMDSKRLLPEEVLASLSAVADPAQRAQVAYETVKQHMKWNERYSFAADQNPRKAWDEASGNVGTINLMLVALYRQLGLEAYPIILSTRSHGKPHPLYPNSENFNYTLAAVKAGESWAFTDATIGVLPFGLLPPKVLNGQGWLVGPNQWIDLQQGAQASQDIRVKLILGEDGQLSAEMKIKESGYPAYYTRAALMNETRLAEWQTEVEGYAKQWQVDSMRWENQEEVYEPLEGTIYLHFEDGFKGDRLYLQPILYGLIAENPFKRESRNFPVDMAYGEQQHYMLNLALPDGYAFEEVPKQGIIRMPNQDAEFTFQVIQVGNMLSIDGKFNVNKLYYLPEEYPFLRQFYSTVIQRLSQPLVIRQKT